MSTRRPDVKGKRQELKEKRRREQQRRRNILIGIVAVVAVLIVIAVIIAQQERPIAGDIVVPELEPRPMAQGNAMGDPNAPVRVEEFSDYLCSHCQAFALDQEPQIVADFVATGQVHFTYVPFSFMAPESSTAAEASYCAADQGKFWEYHDIIFNNVGTTSEPLANQRLRSYAEALELDMEAFNSCFDGGTYRSQVQQDLAYGRQQGVTGTPTFNVNGRMVGRGEVYQVIQEELARLQQ